MPEITTMKAITIAQPYASLIAGREKEFETRSWPTPYRGPLLICAAKSLDWIRILEAGHFSVYSMGQQLDRFPLVKYCLLAMEKHGIVTTRSFPFGAALCVADLVDCIPMDIAFIDAQTEKERAFGYWYSGWHAWKLENVRPLAAPVPIMGKRKLFDARIEADKLP